VRCGWADGQDTYCGLLGQPHDIAVLALQYY